MLIEDALIHTYIKFCIFWLIIKFKKNLNCWKNLHGRVIRQIFEPCLVAIGDGGNRKLFFFKNSCFLTKQPAESPTSNEFYFKGNYIYIYYIKIFVPII